MSTNIRGPYFATNRVANYFIEEKIKGVILNISSETGKVAGTNPYGFSKNIIMQYTEGLAVELGKYGIRSQLPQVELLQRLREGQQVTNYHFLH